MRLLRRVAFGCVDSLPRWKLALPPGLLIAEMVGFEPTDGASRRADFKSGALKPLSHTSPQNKAQPTNFPRDVCWAFRLFMNISGL